MAVAAENASEGPGEHLVRYRWRETVDLQPSRFGFNLYDREGRRIVSVQGRNADLVRSLATKDVVVSSRDPGLFELFDFLIDFGLVEPVDW